MKIIKDQEQTVDIDYELFTAEELIKIFKFYQLVEKHQSHPVPLKVLHEQYREYRNTINSIALEKKYNASFEKQTGISIYQLMHK